MAEKKKLSRSVDQRGRSENLRIKLTHFDYSTLEIHKNKFQLIPLRNGREKKLSRSAGRSAGSVGEFENKANSDPQQSFR